MPQDFRHPLRGDCRRRDCPPCSTCRNDHDRRDGGRHDDRRGGQHDSHRDHRHDNHRDGHGRNNNWW